MKFDGMHLLSIAVGIVIGFWLLPWLLSMIGKKGSM